MRTFSASSRVVVFASCFAVWTILAACTVEEENPATTPRNRRTDAGLDASLATEAGPGSSTGAPLCNEYGGVGGVNAIATAIVSTLKADCRIAPIVQEAEQNRGKNFKDCFDQFVGSGFQCPGVTFVLGQTQDTEGKTCNSQLSGVQFGSLDFKAFTEDVREALKAKGLTDDHIKTLAPVFEGARLKLVTRNTPTDKYTSCAPGCAKGGSACVPVIDAGNDADTPDASDDAGDGDAGDGG